MNRLVIGLIAAVALPAFAVQAADKKAHPPEKAMDQATPEMKNPEGTDKLHPPQKAMDKATPVEKKDTAASKSEKSDSADGASSGTSGSSKTGAMAAAPAEFPDWDIRKAGESVNLKGDSPSAAE